MSKTRLRASKNISTEKLSSFADSVGGRIISIAKEQNVLNQCILDIDEEKYIESKLNLDKIIWIQNEFCDYCRIIADKNKMKLETLDIVSVFSIIKQNIMYYAEKRKIQIDIPMPKINNIIAVDVMKFYYSIFSVLKNSIENSNPGGKIRLSVLSTARYVKIKISDDGNGMDKDTLEQCCEPFFSTNNGLGLGLTIAKSNIEAMGGSLKIKSEKGKETAVVLSLMEAEYAKINMAKIREAFYDSESIKKIAETVFSTL